MEKEVMEMVDWFVLYVCALNVFGYILMGIDKKRAIKGSYRISEQNLWLVALLGGTVGLIIGMYIFRHKTKKWYFTFGLPFFMMLQISCILYLYDWRYG
ncbi:DUF1294 domain-containing protein [Pseudogracilibacillus sp. ICA-222130]|uniref:DUF1294 domain-containing protein n=1 Tax=Pseudogracilibacillus sp. ICA-222130 TaxID=3134655 RepID=UPI0030BE7D22